ncbi:hypothetical protein SDC9_155521 [bioreactor metagenome]|uniref:Uncharacterized protein n=1 Tax=bioreactor metagenome TaxID=1076179 RepID=A0A645F482_9ZZZZ
MREEASDQWAESSAEVGHLVAGRDVLKEGRAGIIVTTLRLRPRHVEIHFDTPSSDRPSRDSQH